MKPITRQGPPKRADEPAKLRRRAEALLKNQPTRSQPKRTAADSHRLLHELQVHQVELAMQNAELQESRNRMEVLLEKYTDLYDFAPVGYFSLDEEGRILEVNLTGAAMLGVERLRLINRPLPRFVAAASQPSFLAFLEQVFAGAGKQVCEAALLKENAPAFWASFHGTSATSFGGPRKWCRVAVSDITFLKRAEEAQRHLEVLANTNRGLNREIARRRTVERALQKSKQHQSRLLKQSQHMQAQLRQLSHQILHAQEEERKRISRELHDQIAQILVGVNVRLAALSREAAINPAGLEQKIIRAQDLVGELVNVVHQFARELRPAVLDDFGLVPALHAYMKDFTKRTGIRIHLTVVKAVEQLAASKRTVLFRVAQEALTNVARHAQASRVEVIIAKLPDCICMTIKDDGKSFQVERANGGKRLGLLGMRERLEMVGGNFAIASAPGEGTTVTAKIPSGKAGAAGRKTR